MNRRRFVAISAASASRLLGLRQHGDMALAGASATTTTTRLCISDYWPFVSQPAENVRQRLRLYRQIGFGTLRADGVNWDELETADGIWRDLPFLTNYLMCGIDTQFRLKLRVGTLSAPPRWFLSAHPDAMLRNSRGEVSLRDISLWYPGLHTLLSKKTDRIFEYLARHNLFDAIDFILVDLGPAGEPIYPAPWTLGQTQSHGPWFYDSHAETAFACAMREKYLKITTANKMWGTNFDTWAHLLPRPGTHPGPLWQDALIWYRISKRNLIRWQVNNYRAALIKYAGQTTGVRLIVMVPGTHIRAAEWADAVHTGNPDNLIAIMTDSAFLLDLSQQTGCWLQYTGVEKAQEVAWLRNYMNEHDITERMWGENAGLSAVARNPSHLIDVILTNQLYGLDYVSSQFLFGLDGTTPNEVFRALAAASERFRQKLR